MQKGVLMNAGQRLKEARKIRGYTQSDLGKRLGVEWTKIKDIEAGKLILHADFAEKIENILSVSGWWLLTGKGAMLAQSSQEKNSREDQNNVVSLNFYDNIYASAGYGAINDHIQPTKMDFDRNFLEKVLGIKKFDRLDIIRVVGDSMLPSIRDGEYMILESGANAKNGDTVIANIKGELYIKRLSKTPFQKWFRLESENAEYQHIDIDSNEKLEACSIVGVVRCKIKLY